MRRRVLQYHTPPARPGMELFVSRRLVVRVALSLIVAGGCVTAMKRQYLGEFLTFFVVLPVLPLQFAVLALPMVVEIWRESTVSWYWRVPLTAVALAGPVLTAVALFRS